jgi:hypothetical protein
MKTKNSNDTSKTFYILGLLVILFAVIFININFNSLTYSMFGIGVLLFVLGLYDTIRPI